VFVSSTVCSVQEVSGGYISLAVMQMQKTRQNVEMEVNWKSLYQLKF